jgi:hypothetical protein
MATMRPDLHFRPGLFALSTGQVMGRITWKSTVAEPTDGRVHVSAWKVGFVDGIADYRLAGQHVFTDLRHGPIEYALTLSVPNDGSEIVVEVHANYLGGTTNPEFHFVVASPVGGNPLVGVSLDEVTHLDFDVWALMMS